MIYTVQTWASSSGTFCGRHDINSADMGKQQWKTRYPQCRHGQAAVEDMISAVQTWASSSERQDMLFDVVNL